MLLTGFDSKFLNTLHVDKNLKHHGLIQAFSLNGAKPYGNVLVPQEAAVIPRTIRFHLDEHVADAVANWLRQLGIDVTTTVEASLLGAEDTDQIKLVMALPSRVIFTENDDSLALAATVTLHAGLAYCQQNTRSIGHIIRALEQPHEMENRVEFI